MIIGYLLGVYVPSTVLCTGNIDIEKIHSFVCPFSVCYLRTYNVPGAAPGHRDEAGSASP